MNGKYPSKYSPCPCGNLDKNGKPVFFSKCCGDKPEIDKLYYDRSLPQSINSIFQLLDPFLTTNPVFFGQLEFQVKAFFPFTKLDKQQVNFLFQKGIPVYNPKSYLSFAFLKLNHYLGKDLDKEKFFSLLFEVLNNEVQIAIGKSLYVAVFSNQRSMIDARLLKQAEQFARLYYTEAGEWHDPEKETKKITSFDHMKARWILDDCILRIRSQWDKLLYLISKGYFDIKIDAKELNYSLDKGKIGQLRRNAKVKNELQQKFLNSFCNLILQIENLKKYRDNLSHTVSEKIQNCLGADEGNFKTIDDLWQLVETEHKRVQEGFIAAVGIFIST